MDIILTTNDCLNLPEETNKMNISYCKALGVVATTSQDDQ